MALRGNESSMFVWPVMISLMGVHCFCYLQVMEGGTMELTPSILNGFDLDAPPDLLTFTVVQPPAHGSLMNRLMGADLLHRGPPITSFTLQELQEGETGKRKSKYFTKAP